MGTGSFCGRVLGRYVRLVLQTMQLTDTVRNKDEAAVSTRKTTVAQQQRHDELQAELAQLRTKAKTAEAALKQAEAQQEEYHRLADRYSELEAQLRGEDRKSK